MDWFSDFVDLFIIICGFHLNVSRKTIKMFDDSDQIFTCLHAKLSLEMSHLNISVVTLGEV